MKNSQLSHQQPHPQLAEALPLSTAKIYRRSWDPNFHKQVFERQPRKDKNAYRVYIPFEHDQDKQLKIPQDLLDYLQSAIPGKPYTTDSENYLQGLAFETANPNRKLSIGKMLARSESQARSEDQKAQLQALKKRFDADPQRAATKKSNKLIVISRHPYDVAGMSTDRGWRSCMHLVTGGNKRYVMVDVTQGSIIAYLINSDDVNINRPLARILIKPYMEKDNPNNLIMMGDMVYGTAPANFKTLVDKWLEKNYNQGQTGLFCLAKGLYRDSIPARVQIYSDQQLQQLPLRKAVSEAIKNPQYWPRLAALRPDGDEILWRVAEQDNTMAAKLIKHIDFDRFTKAIRKKPQILARLHTQTPQMVEFALNLDPKMIRFVRNRSERQHEIVLNLVKKDPNLIKSLHEPTSEQINEALSSSLMKMGKHGYLLLMGWALTHHLDVLNEYHLQKFLSLAD